MRRPGSLRLNCLKCFASLLILSVGPMGCAGQAGNLQSGKQSPNPMVTDTSGPIPADLRDKVRLSEALGRELYINDKMAAIGTDMMLANVGDPLRAGVCGYIVYGEGNAQNQPTGSWWVEFFVDKDEPKLGYIVRITPPEHPGRADVKFETISPPRKPLASHLQMHRAIRTAIEAIPDRPNQPVNPVILPGAAIGERGILVYLLAGTKKDDVVVLGKHYRVLVSEDGGRAVRVEPLTETVLESPLHPPQPDGSKLAGLYVAHLLGDYPLETHVFISLLHHTDLFVVAGVNLWRIHEGKIQLVSVNKSE